MVDKKYTISFTDPATKGIEVLPRTIDGPSGNTRNTDIDFVGLGTSLWGEFILENLLHILENFACEEDIHQITEFPANNQLLISGDVRLAFPINRIFNIWDDGTNDGQYTTTNVSYDDVLLRSTITTITTTFTIAGSTGFAGEQGIPNKALPFSPILPIVGQVWYSKTSEQLKVYNLTGSPETGSWNNIGGIVISDTAPTLASSGDMWWDTTTYNPTDALYGRNLRNYINSVWTPVVEDYLPRDGSKLILGDFDVGNNQILNVADPTDAATLDPNLITSPNDAINVGWADQRYLGTIFGDLDMNGSRLFGLPDATGNDSTESVNVGWANTQYLPLDGIVAMQGSLDLGLNQIINVTDPINNNDVVTKGYADINYTGLPSGNLDLGGNRIFNLSDPDAGSPFDLTQAVTVGWADLRYINIAGDTMTGNLIIDGDLTVNGVLGSTGGTAIPVGDRLVFNSSLSKPASLYSIEYGSPPTDSDFRLEVADTATLNNTSLDIGYNNSGIGSPTGWESWCTINSTGMEIKDIFLSGDFPGNAIGDLYAYSNFVDRTYRHPFKDVEYTGSGTNGVYLSRNVTYLIIAHGISGVVGSTASNPELRDPSDVVVMISGNTTFNISNLDAEIVLPAEFVYYVPDDPLAEGFYTVKYTNAAQPNAQHISAVAITHYF